MVCEALAIANPLAFGFFGPRYFWHTLISTCWVPLATLVGGGTIPPARPRAHEQRAPPRETGLVGRGLIKSRLVTGDLINARFGPICGLKSDISRDPRSAKKGLVPCSNNPPLLMSRSAARSRLVIVDALSSDGPLQIFAHELDMMSQHVQHACICGRDPEIVCLLL